MTADTHGRHLAVREATPADFERINEIYNWTIIDNHVSFDTEPWDIARRSEWWNNRGADLYCLVGEVDGHVIGVTYSSHYRPKPAYRTTQETTIVLDTDQLGKGYGSTLPRYTCLLRSLPCRTRDRWRSTSSRVTESWAR